ncbi:MAG: FIST C-terminal domain-containing protein [Gammaproteobacteria bacterium]|nr:FIST C-terminal domain-containing protein [Gammaproteobacteria bacterium]
MATKFVTGLAKGSLGYDVGKNAAKEAYQKLGDDKLNISLVILFSSSKYDYQNVLRGVREITGNAPVIGCSSAGEFTEEGSLKEGVACALISSDTHKFFTSIGTGLREDEIKCIKEASKNFPYSVKDHPYLSYILLEDGLSGKGEETAMAMLSILGSDMKFAGGSAGDDLRMVKTTTFVDDRALADAVSLAFVASKKPIIIAVQHGHLPISPPLTVTKAKGNTVYEIDGKPAFEIWKKYAAEDAKKTLGIDVNKLQDNNKDLIRFLGYYEAGLYVGKENYKIRWPGLTTTTNGPMKFGTTISEGTVFRVMSSSKENQMLSTRRSAQIIIDRLKGEKLAGAVVFDCVTRGMILQDEFNKTIDVKKGLLKVPFVGFETYGDFAMDEGQMSGYHSATTVILAIPD